MNKKFHFIITGESGKSRSFSLEKKKVFFCLGVSAAVLAAFFCSSYLYKEQNKVLVNRVACLKGETDDMGLCKGSVLIPLKTELAGYKNMVQEQAAELARQRNIIAASSDKIKSLEREKEELLAGSIEKLDKQRRIIARLMKDIGVDVKVEDGSPDTAHQGGAYIPLEEEATEVVDNLVAVTDKYINLFESLPLSRPVYSPITSRYGERPDPFEHKTAFHAGIDFKGAKGNNIYAPGEAVVRVSSVSPDFGNYIILDHGNRYETLYAHMSDKLVKRGDKVERGQVIGLIGNTGRSTGPHLHYEVHYRGKAIDPMRFMKSSDLLSSYLKED